MEKVVLIGSNSAIVTEIARLYAVKGASLGLAARDSVKATALAEDLKVRGAQSVTVFPFDAERPSEHQSLCDHIVAAMEDVDTVVVGHGSLPDQSLCQSSFEATERELKVNFLSPVAIATYFGNYFEQRGKGSLAVITSVAGDRGRQSNYVYGAAKGGLSLFLQGLRNRLAAKNITVLTVKPGFVDTPMTAHLPKGPLFASPEKIARDVFSGLRRKRNILYTPIFWLPIMTIIRLIPEAIFKKLKL